MQVAMICAPGSVYSARAPTPRSRSGMMAALHGGTGTPNLAGRRFATSCFVAEGVKAAPAAAGAMSDHREAEVLAENAGKLPFAKPSAGTLEARCSGAFVCPASSPIWSSKPFARVHKVPRGPWPTGRAQSLRVSSKVDARNSALANPKVDSKALLLIQPMVKMMRRGLQTSAKRKRELKRA